MSRLASYPDITFLYDTTVQEIIGNTEHVTAIKIRNERTQKDRMLKVKWLFLSIGQDPNTAMLNNQLPCNANGCIILPNKNQETAIKGVFCAGRVSNSPYKTGIIASGEGLKAALDAIAFLDAINFHEKIESRIKGLLFTVKEKNNEKNDTAPAPLIQDVSTGKELEKIIESQSNKPIVLKIFSPTCPHCKAMEPLVKSFAAKHPEFVVLQNDITQSDELARFYKVSSIPTIIFIKDGKEKDRLIGQKSDQELEAFGAKHA
jgi:thiol-disulfide isomerase/thioredoxin